ncbi:MAG: hypothetical protein J4A00_04950 [Gammaproteobacteria bacterium]|nr:hypothetical protein [Gammaproteobacteria bacterium]
MMATHPRCIGNSLLLLAFTLTYIPFATATPPRQEPAVVLDINDPQLETVIPGRAEASVWQGTATTTYALRLSRGSEKEALENVPDFFGQTALYLIEGTLNVNFEETTLNMKQGDVAMWGPLNNEIACLTDQCLIFIMAVQDNSGIDRQAMDTR